MRTKILTALHAGGLLVAAGFLTSVISAPGTARGHEQDGAQWQHRPIPRPLGFLSGIFDGLVDDGTITRVQAEAIVSAAEDEAAELKVQRRQRPYDIQRHLRHHFRAGFGSGHCSTMAVSITTSTEASARTTP